MVGCLKKKKNCITLLIVLGECNIEKRKLLDKQRRGLGIGRQTNKQRRIVLLQKPQFGAAYESYPDMPKNNPLYKSKRGHYFEDMCSSVKGGASMTDSPKILT